MPVDKAPAPGEILVEHAVFAEEPHRLRARPLELAGAGDRPPITAQQIAHRRPGAGLCQPLPAAAARFARCVIRHRRSPLAMATETVPRRSSISNNLGACDEVRCGEVLTILIRFRATISRVRASPQSSAQRQTSSSWFRMGATAKGDGPKGFFIEREPRSSRTHNAFRATGGCGESKSAQRDTAPLPASRDGSQQIHHRSDG
jgi:hypothetical protein